MVFHEGDMKTIDISGFGGGYEDTCQQMLKRGVAWLVGHPEFDFKKGFKSTGNPQIRELDLAMTKGLDPSGAMYGTVLGHLKCIHEDGYNAWIVTFKNPPGRVFEYDGTAESCPPGYIPKPGDPPDAAFKAGFEMGRKMREQEQK